MKTFTEYLSEQERRMAAYYAALSNYRRLAAGFAAEMEATGQADMTAVEAAGEELARWRAATERDRMRPIREVAELTGLGVSTLRKLAAEKSIAAERRFGKLWYVLLEEVQEMVAAGEIVPRSQ